MPDSEPIRAVSSWLLWWTWLVGPASYGLAYFMYVIAPESFYGTSDPGPDGLLALVMVLTHLVAGVCTLMLIAMPEHWRAPEFWMLLVYWAGIAGWLMPAFLVTDSRAIDPTFPWVCTRVSAVAVVLMPAVGLARRLLTMVGRPAQGVG